MNEVNNELGYPIVVASRARADVRAFLRGRAFAVLTDARREVAEYARAVTPARGRLAVIPVELGERRKRLSTVERVQEALLAAGVDRTTTVVGVGGGVANDLFGFAASTYMRGVPYAHVATSLVAMVDASIGGKTGVDLAGGKNLAGTFCDPQAVFCAVDALRTLPYRQIREGLAEVVKHGVLAGGDLFEALENLAPHDFAKWPWEALVAESVRVKTDVVADDRTERGRRELLNLGHTFAHGIERASAYRISHGAAVALGLRAAGLLALQTGRFSERDHLRVLALLALLRLPLQMPLRPTDVYAGMQADKKKRAGTLRFVLPESIGDVSFGIAVPERDVLAVLRRMTQPPTAFTS